MQNDFDHESSKYDNIKSDDDFSKQYDTSSNTGEDSFKLNLIQYLSNHADKNTVEDIDKDINRTLLQFDHMQSESIKKSLKNILSAYSVIDKELGYTQGMAFIAGILLRYMDEYSVFSCFSLLMLSNRFKLRDFFIQGFPKITPMNKLWKIALKKYFPVIHRKLNENNAEPILYTVGWWMTAFSCFPFNKDILLLIFDRYLLYGPSSLISFGLTIISICYNSLYHSDINAMISLLQNPCNYPKMNDFSYVKIKWNKYWITNKQFEKMKKKEKIDF